MNTSDSLNDKAHKAATSATADKASGRTKEVIGKVKAKVGHAIGDHELEAKGHVQNAEGKTERLKGEIKEKLDDARNIVMAGVGAMKDKIDELRKR